MGQPDPYATGASLLTALVTAWTAVGGAELPKMRYVAEGSTVAPDGEQLVITVGLLRPGLPGQPLNLPRPARIQPLSCAYSIELLRKRKAGLQQTRSTQSTLPTKTRNVAAGQSSGEDLLAMIRALLRIREDGSWLSNATKILIEGVRPINEGDLVGVVGAVTALLGH